MGEKIRRIAIVRLTDNLESDDRIRKEIHSIRKLFPNILFKIFVVFSSNEEKEGTTLYGVDYKSYRLKSREKYSSGGNLFAKTWDFYRTIKEDIAGYDALWVSGDAPMPMLLFENRMPLIWDLREFPEYMVGNSVRRFILRVIFKRCRVLLHGNQERLDCLMSKGVVKDTSKHIPIKNYPDFSEEDTNEDERYLDVKKWIGNRKCVYLQGLDSDKRAPIETLSVIMKRDDLCAIVLGRFMNSCIENFRNKYGSVWDDKILLVGSVPILQIPKYMRLCEMSMIFYKHISTNNYLCEPNRLYQAINVGLPVVVGNNPTMANVVLEYDCGVVCDTDGADIGEIENGLNKLSLNYGKYIKNIENWNGKLIWSNQDGIFHKVIELLFRD